MKRKTVLILLFIFALLLSGCGKKVIRLAYLDGNNNLYRCVVAAGMLYYQPFRAVNSSSGVYSGGKAWRIKLSTRQLERLKELFIKALDAKTAQSAVRVKGSSQIYLYYSRQKYRSIILKRGSTPQLQLEKMFTSLRKQQQP